MQAPKSLMYTRLTWPGGLLPPVWLRSIPICPTAAAESESTLTTAATAPANSQHHQQQHQHHHHTHNQGMNLGTVSLPAFTTSVTNN